MKTIKRLIKLLISILFIFIKTILSKIQSSTIIIGSGNWSIIYYHKINKKFNKKFSKQLDIIEKCGIPIHLNWTGPIRSNVNYISITFDDGFSSLLDFAIIELFRRKIPFTIFIPSGLIGEYANWIPNSKEKILNLHQIQYLSDNKLVEFGSHGRNHSKISALSKDEAIRDIFDSKFLLEKALKKKVDLFSFPYGAYADRDIQIAQSAGLNKIFTISPVMERNPTKKSVLGRTRVDPEDWPLEFLIKILGGYEWLVWSARIKEVLKMNLAKWAHNGN
jgi:peptidoglycan/xylan/chitin deacetylase (PgdA/CDA1 family)